MLVNLTSLTHCSEHEASDCKNREACDKQLSHVEEDEKDNVIHGGVAAPNQWQQLNSNQNMSEEKENEIDVGLDNVNGTKQVHQ